MMAQALNGTAVGPIEFRTGGRVECFLAYGISPIDFQFVSAANSRINMIHIEHFRCHPSIAKHGDGSIQ